MREQPGFAEAAYGRIFNGRKPDRVPAAVAQPETAGDVGEAVRLARANGWGVSVRSGGHSWAGWSVREGALLIDLGLLREIALDGEVAVVSPAIKGGEELAPFLAARGRTFTGGHCGDVGLGGFLLQGGQGWNSRRWGWGCENVVGIDVVTAEGELVHASADENADLFWAARGAGPEFCAVVVRFHLRTHPALPMFHDTWSFSVAHLEPLLHWLHELLPALDAAVEPVMAARREALLLHTTVAAPDESQAARLLAPFSSGPLARHALAHDRGPTTIAQENLAQAAQNPVGRRYAADSQWTDADAATLYPLLRDVYAELPERSYSIWYGWAPTRELPDMAFSLEHDVYLATYAIWSDPADDERMRSWVHGAHAGLAAVGEGVYVGDSDLARRPDRFLSDAHRARLDEVERRRDPDGVFGRPITYADHG
jgi:FAD/FMN-containing dehydrogenase